MPGHVSAEIVGRPRARLAAPSHAAHPRNGKAGKIGNAQRSEPRSTAPRPGPVFPMTGGGPHRGTRRGVLVRAARLRPKKAPAAKWVPDCSEAVSEDCKPER
jgi:hypothetical protein